MDTVITNSLVVDVSGIYKADIGLKDGVIAGIGKAGNPDTQPDVDIGVFAADVYLTCDRNSSVDASVHLLSSFSAFVLRPCLHVLCFFPRTVPPVRVASPVSSNESKNVARNG